MSRSRSRSKPKVGAPRTVGAADGAPGAAPVDGAVAATGNGSGDDATTAVAQRETFERAALVGILIIASLLRLIDLGRRPLQIEEADLALRSWALARGDPAHLAGEALLVNANTAMVFLFGGDDGIVRLLAALAGIGLVGITWAFRPWLGTTGALAAALLFAISPTAVYFSRLTSSAILVATLLLALVAILWSYMREPRTWLVFAGAVVVGLLAVAGPLVWTALIAVAAAAVVHFLIITPTTARSSAIGLVAPSWRPTAPPNLSSALVAPIAVRRRGLALAIVVATLVATGLATNPSGLQTGFVDSIATWWDVATAPSAWPLWFHLAFLFAYDTPALAIGVPAAVVLTRQRHAWAQFLSLWAASSLLLGSLVWREPAGALLILLPLLLLAGGLVGHLADSLRSREVRTRAGFHLAAATILAGFSWVAVVNRDAIGLAVGGIAPLPIGGLIAQVTALAPFLGAAALTAFTAHTLGRQTTLWLSATTIAVLATAVACHATFNLNFATTGVSPFEMVTSRATSPDVHNLRADVDLIQQVLLLRGSDHQVVVESRYQPLLSWYFKDLDDVQFVEGITGSPPIVVAAPDTDPPRGTYVAQRYQIVEEARFQLSTWDDWLRWWMLRDMSADRQATTVVVYVRS